MKLSRFKAILDAYGASSERWPERERATALALARSSVAAARALAEARALDEALLASEFPEYASEPTRFAALRARIVAAAVARKSSWIVEWLGVNLVPAQLWPSAAGLALATVLGFVVGLTGLIQIDTEPSDDALAMTALDLSIDGTTQ